MIRVLLVDDHRLVRAAMGRIIADDRNMEIVGETGSGEEAVELVRKLNPHVVLMDMFMPGIGGMEATRRILRAREDVKVIAVSTCADRPFPEQMLRIGAAGYLTKSATPQDLLAGIRKVFYGQRYVSADVAQALAFSTFDRTTANPFDTLSNREMQIMLMVVNCHKVQDISGNLHLSPKTVNSYRYRIFEKLGISSDVELTLMAVRHGVLDPESLPTLAGAA
ncbi:MAG: UvrY/SirA/GacA family response regulator transcription factor [Pseudomonadales bacterium]|nr:UvrY/SirA/GacA family response regulator transcription factor [Pseudomonadales bacterium]MCP5184913.1 UvrY/SirA/GacA family response regulator transcription factor [Pseudomonadales bacterium]